MDDQQEAYPGTETNTSVNAGQTLERLLGAPCCYYPMLAHVLRLPTAIFLSQLLMADHDGDGWVGGLTQKDWELRTGLSRRAWLTARQSLLDEGLVEEAVHGGHKALRYRVDIEAIQGRVRAHRERAKRALKARETRASQGARNARLRRAKRALEVPAPIRKQDLDLGSGFDLEVDLEPTKLGGRENERGGSTSVSSRRGSQLPDSWSPSDRLVAWAQEHFSTVNVALETDTFRDHARSKGRVARDWNAAWRNWIRKAAQFAAQRATVGATTGAPQYRPASEVLAEAAGQG